VQNCVAAATAEVSSALLTAFGRSCYL